VCGECRAGGRVGACHTPQESSGGWPMTRGRVIAPLHDAHARSCAPSAHAPSAQAGTPTWRAQFSALQGASRRAAPLTAAASARTPTRPPRAAHTHARTNGGQREAPITHPPPTHLASVWASRVGKPSSGCN